MLLPALSTMQSAAQSAEAHSNPILKDVHVLAQLGLNALKKCRCELALKYFDRALALAEATEPADTLVVSQLLLHLGFVRATFFHGNATLMKDMNSRSAAWNAAWLEDTHIRHLSRRNVELLVSRFDAGKLFRATPDEAEFSSIVWSGYRCDERMVSLFGPELLLEAAHNATAFWEIVYDFQSSGFDVTFDLMMRGLAAALRVVLRQCKFHGAAEETVTGFELDFTQRQVYLTFQVLCQTFTSPHLPWLQARCGLSSSDVSKLSFLYTTLRDSPLAKQYTEEELNQFTCVAHSAAADVARHGLRRCALPGCGAAEPHPKAFKVCGRCKSTAYCSAEHAAQDWRRHKHAECSRPAGA